MNKQLKKYMKANLLDGDKVHDCIMVSSKECYDVMKNYLKDYKPEIDEEKLEQLIRDKFTIGYMIDETAVELLVKAISRNIDKIIRG